MFSIQQSRFIELHIPFSTPKECAHLRKPRYFGMRAYAAIYPKRKKPPACTLMVRTWGLMLSLSNQIPITAEYASRQL